MNLLPNSLPRAAGIQQLYEDPLGFLAQARSSFGDIFVIRDGGPIFSRAPDCAGAIAVFGPAHVRAALSDIELFGMPVSAAQHLSLPQNLFNLNRGLHSMRGEQHAQHQRLLSRALGERTIEDHHHAVSDELETFAQGWKPAQKIALLGEMRELVLQVSTRLLFGDQYADRFKLASLLRAFFQFRREAASPFSPAGETLRQDLISLGTSLDDALRRFIRWCRQDGSASSGGVLTKLARIEFESGKRLSDDELVAHCNVLFISCNEPIAIALTWTLLILSQLPGLRRALRHELDQASPSELARLTLLDCVINESMRLLPPNALMVRVTTRPASLNGVLLPERCELVLCPFLAHRDEDRFPNPKQFLPSRWRAGRPSPFEYFPFGAGGHSCVGGHLATYLMKAALASLVRRYELVLDGDQEIDWRIHIQFMPRTDPRMLVLATGASRLEGGRLLGPVGDLISLDACEP